MLNNILEAVEENKPSLILYIIIYAWESQTLFSENEKE